MRTAFIILALAVAGTLADGFHRHSRNQRQGRRQQSFRRQGRNRAFRRGRTDEAAAAAPLGLYGAASETTAAPEVLPPPDYYDDPALDVYAAQDDPLGPGGAEDSNLAMLEKAVPGIPGEDYPIFSEVPESGFSCDGQVDGGYYADPEAQCQVFHICTADGQGGLAKYSFLCPNGTIFNQNYFICDWWFNFDCAEAEGLYGLNEEIAAEREAASAAGGNAAAPADGYGAAADDLGPLPTDYDYLPEADYEAAPDYEAAGDYAAAAADYSAVTEVPPAAYGAPPGGDEPILPTAPPPTYQGEQRDARRFNGRRGRTGRRNSFRSNSRRQGRRQGNRNNRNFRG